MILHAPVGATSHRAIQQTKSYLTNTRHRNVQSERHLSTRENLQVKHKQYQKAHSRGLCPCTRHLLPLKFLRLFNPSISLLDSSPDSPCWCICCGLLAAPPMSGRVASSPRRPRCPDRGRPSFACTMPGAMRFTRSRSAIRCRCKQRRGYLNVGTRRSTGASLNHVRCRTQKRRR